MSTVPVPMTLADANLIDAKEQITPLTWMDTVEEALWKERSRILYTRISSSLHYLYAAKLNRRTTMTISSITIQIHLLMTPIDVLNPVPETLYQI
jgi:hypothetical protein